MRCLALDTKMIIGHKLIVENLKKLADKNELAQGYIFFGPKMVGKKSVALCLANYLENRKFEEPQGVLVDSFVLKSESKKIGIDEARKLKHFLWQKPAKSAYRLAIIDDSESMTEEAANAFLKITEEPPLLSKLIFITDHYEKLPATFHSRFHKIYFSRLSGAEVERWLKKEFSLNPDEAKSLAVKSFGLPGLAVNFLKNNKFLEFQKLSQKFLNMPASRIKDFIGEIVSSEDFDMNYFLDAVILYLSYSNRRNFKFWHKLLDLRREVERYNLNPKIQLLALTTAGKQ